MVQGKIAKYTPLNVHHIYQKGVAKKASTLKRTTYIEKGLTKNIQPYRTYMLNNKKEVYMVEVYPKYTSHTYKIIMHIRYISSIKRTARMVFRLCLNYIYLILVYKKKK